MSAKDCAYIIYETFCKQGQWLFSINFYSIPFPSLTSVSQTLIIESVESKKITKRKKSHYTNDYNLIQGCSLRNWTNSLN